MSAVDERINGWFALAREILSETGWEVAAAQPEGRLLHCSRASGGRLIKFDFDSIVIEEMGHLNPEEIAVRPEVRGLYHPHTLADMQFRTLQTLEPGFAKIEMHLQVPVLRLCQLLFGNAACVLCDLFHTEPAVAWHQLRRSYPEPGMCTVAILQEVADRWQEYMLILHRSSHTSSGNSCSFRMAVCLSVPSETFAHWASPFFSEMIRSAKEVLTRSYNHPCTAELREIGKRFYIILSLRNFNRGPPMLPSVGDDGVAVSISGGEDMGLCCWTDYRTDEKFRLAEYLQCFLKRLGYADIDLWSTLDARVLVPYQCVMRRSQWEDVKDRVLKALSLQKTAYRRAKGGTTAPSLVEDVLPRFAEQKTSVPENQHRGSLKVVVRNTFLELEEEILSGDDLRRIKSECELPKLVVA